MESSHLRKKVTKRTKFTIKNKGKWENSKNNSKRDISVKSMGVRIRTKHPKIKTHGTKYFPNRNLKQNL